MGRLYSGLEIRSGWIWRGWKVQGWARKGGIEGKVERLEEGKKEKRGGIVRELCC